MADIPSNPLHQTISDEFVASQARRGIVDQQAQQIGDYPNGYEEPVQNVKIEYYRPGTAPVRKKKKKRSLAGKAVTRTRATGATVWINSWVITLYLIFQLPFAIASTVAFGMVAFIYSAISSADEIEGMTGFFVRAGIAGLERLAGYLNESFYEVVLRVANAAFGIDFDPMALFLMGFALVFAFGMLQLLAAWFMFSISGVRSLSGSASAGKQATFILAAIGICIPVLNLFPLILLWTAVVWFNPD